MTVVVMNNMTTIGLTLYISALPVTDRIKALKVAAEAGSFSFSLLLVCLQEALCSVFNHVYMNCVSCQGSVSCIYDRTHAFTKVKKLFLRYLPPPINSHSIPYMKKKDNFYGDISGCPSVSFAPLLRNLTNVSLIFPMCDL